MNDRPLAVLGAGAVGTILSAYLGKAGEKVALVEGADGRREQVAKDGLVVTGKVDNVLARPTNVLRSIEELRDLKPSALFICTKTWSLKTILPALAKVLPTDTLVISFQNGIGPEDDVAEFFEPERVARGIVNLAGGVNPDGSVTMQWFNPPNYLGMLEDGSPDASARLDRVKDVLNGAHLTTKIVPSQETKKRAFFKTILNSALTALCASSGITMRQAMTYGHTRNMAHVLIREGLSVAAAVGYNYGEKAKEACMRYLDEGGDHLPSMWTDLQRGSPTEIEYINGKIVKIGLMFKNIDVDTNLFFTSMIITQEIKSGVRKPTEIPEYLTHF
ncbi:MAG: 2-dehydropantoate 2-reductase [Deltaproteobacteria bacterium]|nr:2-dehydropantoate 2-reductase [Deltaproteobacteria bacterium]